MTPTPPIPKLKLTYFDGPWRAESIRSAFKLGGIAFEDDRIAMKDFPALKATLPFGSVPILTVDNENVISQSGAILHYAGKITDLYPKCPIIAMKVDEAIGGLNDLYDVLGKAKAATEFEEKKKIGEVSIPRYAAPLDKLFAKNKGGPFLLGNKVSIADCQLDMVMNMLAFYGLPETLLDEYTHLLAARKAFKKKLEEA